MVQMSEELLKANKKGKNEHMNWKLVSASGPAL